MLFVFVSVCYSVTLDVHVYKILCMVHKLLYVLCCVTL